MRAAIIAGPGQVRIDSNAVRPEPAAGEVRVRLQGCGVCGSNLPVWEGRPWFTYPFEPAGAPGHEGWGVIDAVGAGVDSGLVGERVALLSMRAFAEYDVAAAERVVRIPAALAGQPFPGEPLACACNVFARSDIQSGHDVVIIGIGFLGALLTQLAVHAGARVIAVSRRAYARDLALALGAAEAHSFEQAATLQAVRVIECIGTQDALDLATQIMAVRGRLVIAGYHQDGPRAVNMQQWNWRGIDVINAHERASEIYSAGLRAALGAATEGVLQLEPLLTHRFALEELPTAFTLMRERPAGFLKAYVTV